MTVNDFQLIEVEGRHSADTIASELMISGYVVKQYAIYKKIYPHTLDYFRIEFYKPKKKIFAGDGCDE